MFGVICGPLLGPIIGGFLIISELGWRSTFWFCFAFGIFIFCVTFLLIPETFRDNEKFDGQLSLSNNKTMECFNNTRTSRQTSCCNNEVNPVISESVDTEQQSEKEQAEKEQHRTQKNGVVDEAPKRKEIFNPFAPFALLRYPFILMSSVVAGLFFGAMFATEAILPEVFSKTYRLNSWQVGLSYLGAGIGNLSGAFVGGRLSDRLLLRSRRLRGGKAKAEDRLTINMWFAGVICNPLGLLIFGWVVEYKLSFWGGYCWIRYSMLW